MLRRGRIVLAAMLGLLPASVPAQELHSIQSSNRTAQDLKRLSIEELMQIDVTSVSRRSERVFGAAAAVSVITGEEIRRLGATNLPDALRLTASLQVAQLNGYTWAVSARGFNLNSANKLLVLIDGRSIYSPLFSGVFWDMQDVVLEDVERIEVVSGPGGPLLVLGNVDEPAVAAAGSWKGMLLSWLNAEHVR